MKAILEFNLPDDDSEYIFANNGKNYWAILKEMETEMRRIVKYDNNHSKQFIKGVEYMNTFMMKSIREEEIKWETIL